MKRKYRISRNSLGYYISKYRETESMISLWYLWSRMKREIDKDHAKTFYTEDDAKGALVLMRRKDAKESD